MSVGCRELVVTDKPTVVSEPFLNGIVVVGSQSDGYFPDPPAPMRAIGVNPSARSTILLIMSSRPKQVLGGGGGNSPGVMLLKLRAVDFAVFETVDLA